MHNQLDQIQQAAKVIQAGGVIIFPTDTAFGIGCRIDSTDAVDRVFSIRKRPTTQATPVLVSSKQLARKYFINPNSYVLQFMDKYWPGALTIVSYCDTSSIYSLVRGGGDTIGLRMPNHETIRAIIEVVGVPILGPSANFHGLPTPYSFESLDPELVKLVDYTVEGDCFIGQASTVVDCTKNPYTILRQGSIILSD